MAEEIKDTGRVEDILSEIKVEDGVTSPEPTFDPNTGEVVQESPPAEPVADTGEPETEPVVEAEPEPEVEPEPVVEPEAEENWEKRYKDVQADRDRRLADKDKELTEALRYRQLVDPYKDKIKEASDGRLEFAFTETTKAPEEPTQDLWVENPQQAAKEYADYRDFQRDQQLATKEKELQFSKQEDSYKATRVKSWDKTQELYPDAGKVDSELHKKAEELLAKDPALTASPYCDMIVTQLAANELGIKPVSKDSPSPAPKPKKKDTSYIISGGSGSGGAGSTAKDLSEAEFTALPTDAQDKYLEEQFMRANK